MAGSKNVEYKKKLWHEECFTCFECNQPIRTQSFVAKGDNIYCNACNEKKFAKNCFHCKEVRSTFTGGVKEESSVKNKACGLNVARHIILFGLQKAKITDLK